MKAALVGMATAAGLALAAPPYVALDEWPTTLSWPHEPIPSAGPDWQPAADQVCLYLTNDYFWQGYGVNLCQANDQCSPKVPDGLSANISSAGPNEKQVCYLYSEIDCAGTASAPITNPGYDNLGKIGFDKLAQSWKCWRTDNVTALDTSSTTTASSTTSTREPPSPFPESTSRPTIIVTLPATTSTVTISSTLSTASTGEPIPSSTPESTTSIYSTVSSFGPQITPRVVTHTYVNGSTVVTTLFKRAEEAVSTTLQQKYICTTLYPRATYVPTRSTSTLTTSWMTMWYQCPGTEALPSSPASSATASSSQTTTAEWLFGRKYQHRR